MLMLRFSSDAVKPRERIEFWDDLLARTLTPFRTEPAGEHVFRIEVGMQMAGELPIVTVEESAIGGRGGRPRSHIRAIISMPRPSNSAVRPS
jgi:hypothetical protein